MVVRDDRYSLGKLQGVVERCRQQDCRVDPHGRAVVPGVVGLRVVIGQPQVEVLPPATVAPVAPAPVLQRLGRRSSVNLAPWWNNGWKSLDLKFLNSHHEPTMSHAMAPSMKCFPKNTSYLVVTTGFYGFAWRRCPRPAAG
ncbi:hypothetical protein IWX87_002327 [Polaromonas sp. CG_9.7]|nr:hypothetical protein [Polaromonas sp. CG_9.7]MBG6114717.1 hypothetical protein [Polaromonas sp. CG_9.2]